MERIEGTVETVTYQNEDSGYCVLQVSTAHGLLTCVGSAHALRKGMLVSFDGNFATHKRFGRQFAFVRYDISRPTTVDGITHLLESGLISNIGAKRARLIVDAFGIETLNVLDNAPDRLSEVAGIGKKTLAKIKDSWAEERHKRGLVLFLQEHDISAATANRLYKAYGGDAERRICENPYTLIDDVWGIGFVKADAIAVKMGFDVNSYKRIKAGLIYTLQEAASTKGHTYLPKAEIEAVSTELLGVTAEQVLYTLDYCISQEILICEDECVYLPYLYHAEAEVARCLSEKIGGGHAKASVVSGDNAKNAAGVTSKIISRDDHRAKNATGMTSKAVSRDDHPAKNALGITSTISRGDDVKTSTLTDKEIDEFIASYQQKTGWIGAPEQLKAIHHAAKNKIFILTGGPGTGKTTALRAIVALFAQLNLRIALAAPTGRAAARMGSLSGIAARTIHRLLEFKPSGDGARGFKFLRCETNPIEADAVILDEASMIDITLMKSFIAAVPRDAALILVGDKNQLPSVGPGNVLADLIACEHIPHVELTRIFRQSAKSRIVTAAHEIIGGETPEFSNSASDNCFLLAKNDSVECLDTLVDLVSRRLPARYGLDPMADIQVLSPMHRGTLGTVSINAALAGALNKNDRKIIAGQYTFTLGDRVIQTKNNYDAGVFNGDIGFITAIAEGNVMVTFDKTDAVYDERDLDQIIPAYCISIHKSQGSEFRAVVIPISTQHFIMLQRNLIYTALTRAKELCVFVGTKNALSMAVRNDKALTRNSRLCELIDNGSRFGTRT